MGVNKKIEIPSDPDELKALLEKILRQNEELEAQQEAENTLKKIIEEDPSVMRLREKIYLRRTRAEIPQWVSAQDVLDERNLQEVKRTATGNKRIYTDDKELKAYQMLKENSLEPNAITYEMVKEKLKNSENKFDPAKDQEKDTTTVRGEEGTSNSEAEDENTDSKKGGDTTTPVDD